MEEITNLLNNIMGLLIVIMIFVLIAIICIIAYIWYCYDRDLKWQEEDEKQKKQQCEILTYKQFQKLNDYMEYKKT